LANHKSAIKRIRINDRRRLRNRIHVSATRTEITKARKAIAGSDVAAARAAVVDAIRKLDKSASNGVLHKNNAARRKSRLMKHLAAMEASKK
jgi:small subunit ribosomal protein S20